MAVAATNPLYNIDYSKYNTWPKVVSKIDGKTYYQVPGQEGAYFDPLSGRNGRVSRLPEQQIEDKKRVDSALNPQPGAGEQIAGAFAPIAGTAGGILLANQIAGTGAGAAAAGTAAGTAAGVGAGTAGAAGAGAGTGAGILGTAGSAGAAGTVAGTAGAAGAAGAGTAAAGAGTAAGAGAATTGATTGTAGAASAGGAGILPIAGVAAGTYLGGREVLNLVRGKDDKSLQGRAGRVVLGMATGGLSELARPFILHESTRDVAKKHTKQLLEQGKDDQAWQGYVQGMRQQYNEAPTDPTKPFAGKYGSWNEYKKAGLEASDLTGVYGNLKTFGPEWASLSQEQRQAVTQGLINADLYDSKKGEVILKDAEAAKKIKDSIIGKTAVTKPQERVSGKNLGILNTQSAKPEPQITKKEEEKSLGILGKRIKRK